MEKTIETVRTNFNSIRTGRANPAILDRVEVCVHLQSSITCLVCFSYAWVPNDAISDIGNMLIQEKCWYEYEALVFKQKLVILIP